MWPEDHTISSCTAASCLFISSIILMKSAQKRSQNQSKITRDETVFQSNNSEDDFHDLSYMKTNPECRTINRVESDISLGFSASKSTDDFLRELGPLCIKPKIDKVIKTIRSRETQIGASLTIIVAAVSLAALSYRVRRL